MIWAGWVRATAGRPTGHQNLALIAAYILAWVAVLAAMILFRWDTI